MTGPTYRNVGGSIIPTYDRPAGARFRLGQPQQVLDSLKPHRPQQDTLSRWQPQETVGPSTPEGGTKKVVYWDSKAHHIVEAPVSQRFKWQPPQLVHNDLTAGQQLAVRETPGAIKVKLVGSKHRYLPSMEPGGVSMWAVSRWTNTQYDGPLYATLGPIAGTNSDWYGKHGANARPHTSQGPALGSTIKAEGTGALRSESARPHGAHSWQSTQSLMLKPTGQMLVGQPSRMMGVAEQEARA